MTSKQLFSTSFFQHSEKNHIKLNSQEHESQTKWKTQTSQSGKHSSINSINSISRGPLPFLVIQKKVQDLGSDLKEVTLSFSEEQEDALRLYGMAGGLRPKHFFPSFLWRKIWFLVENSWIQSRIYDI
jgi:hypothetical protein